MFTYPRENLLDRELFPKISVEPSSRASCRLRNCSPSAMAEREDASLSDDAGQAGARTCTKIKVVQFRAAGQVEANGKNLRRTCFSQLLAALKLRCCSDPRPCPPLSTRMLSAAADGTRMRSARAEQRGSQDFMVPFSYSLASASKCTVSFMSAACAAPAGAALCRRLARCRLALTRRAHCAQVWLGPHIDRSVAGRLPGARQIAWPRPQ